MNYDIEEVDSFDPPMSPGPIPSLKLSPASCNQRLHFMSACELLRIVKAIGTNVRSFLSILQGSVFTEARCGVIIL